MAQEDIHPHAKPITLIGDGDMAFFLVHGYTGSPTDFNGLPYVLLKELNASVYIPLLPGHGSKVENLLKYRKDDFLEFVEQEFVRVISRHPKVIVGGHSFGGQVALHLAGKYEVHGVFITATPLKPAFLLSIPGLYEFWKTFFRKEFLRKRRSKEEMQNRKLTNAFSYEWMPAYGLKLIKDLNKDLKNTLKNIKAQILYFYVRKDSIADIESVEELERGVSSARKKKHIFESLEHGVFFTDDAPQIYEEVVNFFKY